MILELDFAIKAPKRAAKTPPPLRVLRAVVKDMNRRVFKFFFSNERWVDVPWVIWRGRGGGCRWWCWVVGGIMWFRRQVDFWLRMSR